MSTPVEQIKARLSIVDVVGNYVKLEKAGSSFKALCPFHNEKSASFNVSPSRDSYYCFGCNRGGDIFTFVEEIEGIEFVDALKLLADRAGVPLTHEVHESRSEREKLYQLMEEATLFYERQMLQSQEVKDYLVGRGLTEDTIRNFRIGFAPLEWRAVYDHLKSKGYADGEIERAGLVKAADKPVSSSGLDAVRGTGKTTTESYNSYDEEESGSRNEEMRQTRRTYYDRFRGRVMFPIFDANGRVVAFSGRVFGEQKNQDGTDVAKYINSPETLLYDKSSIMFGYDRAKRAIRTQNFTILVEGQMDLIMSHQAGAENTVAVSGTALTEKHLTLLKRLSDNLVFAFDADEAGLRATARAFRLALALGMAVRVVAIPDGKDPADFIKAHPKEEWAAVIASSAHIIDFYMKLLASRGYDSLRFRKEVESHILPLVLDMRSSIEQAHFIIEIARKLGVPEQAVWEEVKRLRLAEKIVYHEPRREEAARPESSNALIKDRRQVAEEEIIGILDWQEKHKEPAIDVPATRISYHARISIHGLRPKDLTEDEKRSLSLKAEYKYEHGPELLHSIEELLDTLEEEVLRERQSELWRRLSEAEQRGAKDESKTISLELNQTNALKKELEDRRTERRNT